MTQEVLNCLQGAESAAETPEEASPEAGCPERTEEESEERASAGTERGAAIRTHLETLRAQAAELPGFDLEQALRDPAFVRLTAPGVGVPVRDAWYALHREESERRSAEENRAMLARAAAASARRPREGGGSGGSALIAADYRSLSRAEQLRVKKRIFEAGARGEKIYP